MDSTSPLGLGQNTVPGVEEFEGIVFGIKITILLAN